MRDLRELVSRKIREHRLFTPRQRILVAVSGGLDSMVLLHLLHNLSRETGWRLAVAHLNHQLRGQSSNADERLVRRTARALRLPAVIERADVRALTREGKLSLEMASREARHTFLARTAIGLGISVVALAHHADDQLELFFLRLLRGSGSQGLAGMQWKTCSPASGRVTLARPLLDSSKAALREYASQYKISYREDATNADLDILRNRIRHHLLPLLERTYQPALRQTVARAVEILRSESEFVEQAAAAWLARTPGTAPKTAGIKSKDSTSNTERPPPFDHLHVSVQRRCLQAQLIGLEIVPDYVLVEKLRTTCNAPVSIGLPAPSPGSPQGARIAVLRDATGLLHLRETAPVAFVLRSLQCDLGTRAGTQSFDGLRLCWRFDRKPMLARHRQLSRTEFFDADQVGSCIFLRHWQPGDRFQPIGMQAEVKLQDYFTNQKVPRSLRHKMVVAATARGEIFWVEGMRISERFKLTGSTIRRLQWAWERL